jgi:hypothetical protein
MMAIVRKIAENKNTAKGVEKIWSCIDSTLKDNQDLLKMLNIKLTYAQSIFPLLGVYARQMKIFVLRKACRNHLYKMFTASLFMAARKWKHAKCLPLISRKKNVGMCIRRTDRCYTLERLVREPGMCCWVPQLFSVTPKL